MDRNDCLLQIQQYLENNPLIILGSGASVQYKLPSMHDLKEEILSNQDKFVMADITDFHDNLNRMDLETAMDTSNLSNEVRETIRKIVWECVNKHDIEFFNSQIVTRQGFAIADLFKKIIQPSPNEVVVVTTNYDRLAEYAADVIGANAITGFEGIYLKMAEFPNSEIRRKRIQLRERSVYIWKVHGSLDWFKDMNGNIVSYPLSDTIPKDHVPLIIPPGKQKYSNTYDEPYRDIIAQADKYFTNAGSFLCIGYGFNDEHIQPKLIKQIKDGKPIVVLCREATEACKCYVISNDVKKYVVIEFADNGKTRIIGSDYKEEYDGGFWELPNFVKTIWG